MHLFFHNGQSTCPEFERLQLSKRFNISIHTYRKLSRLSSNRCWCQMSSQKISAQLYKSLGLALISSVAIVSSLQGSAAEDEMTIRFKASKLPEIREAQEALVQTWGYVSTQYLDKSFNGVDWPRELQANLDKSFTAQEPIEVYNIIQEMLEKLGDPFTRVIPPGVAGAFENMTEGQIVGMGFQVSDTQEGVFVVFVADNSPAQRAGVQIGDRLLSLNGKVAGAAKKEELAAMLRSEADVILERTTNQEGGNKLEQISLHLKPEPIEVHPVQYALLPGGSGQGTVGYIRLIVFSKNAAKDAAEALQNFQDKGVNGIILDLRDNVGGVVLSGYEVAQLFMPEGARFCYVEDGRGSAEDVKMLESRQMTDKPITILINAGTASTAELITASLHDTRQALTVGEKSFGKGRTQRVIKLRGDAILLLSNTTYLTPNHQVVDKVGLTPDVACKPKLTETAYWNSGKQQASGDLLEDPCIHLAVERLVAS